MSADRAGALREIVQLARAHGLTVGDIATALADPLPEARGPSVVVRVLGVLGGIFIFAGVGVFIALQWDSMSSAARVIVTLGPGVAAFVLAILATRDVRFDKAATPLFLIAAALEPTGMLVAFAELGSGGDWRWAGVITSGAVALQFAGVFLSLRRSAPLFLAVTFATLCWWTTLDLLEADEEVIALIVGASLLLAATGVDRTPHREITSPWYFFGASAFLYAVFDFVEDTPVELLFLGVAAAFVYLATLRHSRTLLFVATAAILAYTGYFTGEHFAQSVGWPIALILFGLSMIGLSALAVRIDRLYVRAPRERPGG